MTKPWPPRLLHPRRVFEGVREGVEHGGNKSGIPTVNGSIVFDERYLGKPLVYCGTIGLIPAEVPASKSSTDGKPRKGYEKKAQVGDIIVMTGGRIGKDGIHGATFSSEELHEGSPATAVQIGDPITQRKMYDFIMRARDLGLYNAITDNGAGGLSSSIGEMAEDTNGCRIDLARAPLKYDGLRPWEILLSEAQERMTLAVPPAALDEFLALAKRMDVEATPLGEFTDDGVFHVTYNGKLVAHLDMEFMHDGVPQYQLNAVWEAPVHPDARIEDGGVDQAVFDEYKAKFLQQMGNDLNTSMGITAVFDVLKAKTSDATKLALIGDFDTVLSLDLLEKAEKIRQEQARAAAAQSAGGYTVTGEGDPAIDALVLQRYEAKKAKDFAEADRIRDQLKSQGIEITDRKDGASWKRV